MKETNNYLNELLNDNDTIIVACSGGPDSMCLLSLIIRINKRIQIICAHINHNVRKESVEEYKYVKEYCETNKIIFEGTTIESYSNDNFENEARNFRYNYFEALRKKYNANYIMTAHHGDDLIETILMRITRGSNLSGYSGIKLRDNHYIRPLLLTNKEEIIKYLDNNSIKYFIDKTNDEDIHTRNRYRHVILPFLKKENKNIDKKYYAFSKELQDYDSFVNSYIDKLNIIDDNIVNIKLLMCESFFIQKKVIERLIKNIQKDYYLEVSNITIENVLDFITSKKSNCTIDLNNGFVASKKYNNLSIEKKQDYIDYSLEFDDYFENEDYIIKKENSNDKKSNYVIRLAKKEITFPLIIRNRREKDKMIVKNLGTKKIKDIYIDEKLETKVRNTIPLLVDSNNIVLWIPGIKKSKFDKEKNENYDIIISCERKTSNDKCKKK